MQKECNSLNHGGGGGAHTHKVGYGQQFGQLGQGARGGKEEEILIPPSSKIV